MMAARKAGRPARKPRPTLAHLPGYDGRMELAPAIVDDPMEKGRVPLTVMRNIAASPLTAIHARGRLRGRDDTFDDAEARHEAGKRFRGLYERAEMGGSRAIDYSAAKVDVSFVYRGVPESAGEAMRELASMAKSKTVGPHYYVLHKVVGEETSFMRWADQMAGRPASGAERLECYQRIRDALDALISHWGVAKGRAGGKIRAEVVG